MRGRVIISHARGTNRAEALAFPLFREFPRPRKGQRLRLRRPLANPAPEGPARAIPPGLTALNPLPDQGFQVFRIPFFSRTAGARVCCDPYGKDAPEGPAKRCPDRGRFACPARQEVNRGGGARR